jgi:hypothetical protein
MKTTMIFSLLAASLLMTGCGQEVKSLDYYRTHPDEQQKVGNDCMHKAGNHEIKLVGTNFTNEEQNCLNALHRDTKDTTQEDERVREDVLLNK